MAELEFCTVEEKVKEWGKSKSMICRLCQNGRIDAQKLGKTWLIPKDAKYPDDLRFAANVKKNLELKKQK